MERDIAQVHNAPKGYFKKTWNFLTKNAKSPKFMRFLSITLRSLFANVHISHFCHKHLCVVLKIFLADNKENNLILMYIVQYSI